MVRWFYWFVAVIYPLAALAVFTLTGRADPFALFDRVYGFVALVLVPGILCLLVIGLAFTGRAPGRWWRLALIAWIGLVTYGHNLLIGAAASGV